MLLPLWVLSSCVTSERDLIIVNDRISSVDRRVDSLEKSTDKKLSEGVNAKVKSVQDRQAEMGTEITSLREETQRLSGRMDENNHLIKRTVERDTSDQDKMRAELNQLAQRTAELESKVEQLQARPGGTPSAHSAPPPPREPAAATRESSKPVKEPAKEQAQPEQEGYERALAAFKEGKYEQAVTLFNAFLTKHPNSDLSDNAQFWIGECHMSLKQYEQAILAYQEVIKKHPKGNKVPNALLRQAVAFAEIKDTTSAKLLLKKVIKEYPNSSEAQIAKSKLNALGGQ